MLKGIQGNIITTQCNACDTVKNTDVTGVVIPKGEWGDWRSYNVTCDACGAMEGFNLNIPVNDTDEPYAAGDLPENEEIQRYYVRLLIRMIRADYVTGA